jgi:hypothetical protein
MFMILVTGQYVCMECQQELIPTGPTDLYWYARPESSIDLQLTSHAIVSHAHKRMPLQTQNHLRFRTASKNLKKKRIVMI